MENPLTQRESATHPFSLQSAMDPRRHCTAICKDEYSELLKSIEDNRVESERVIAELEAERRDLVLRLARAAKEAETREGYIKRMEKQLVVEKARRRVSSSLAHNTIEESCEDGIDNVNYLAESGTTYEDIVLQRLDGLIHIIGPLVSGTSPRQEMTSEDSVLLRLDDLVHSIEQLRGDISADLDNLNNLVGQSFEIAEQDQNQNQNTNITTLATEILQTKKYEDASLQVQPSIDTKDVSLQTQPVELEVMQEIQPKKYRDASLQVQTSIDMKNASLQTQPELEMRTQEPKSKQYEDVSLQVELEVTQGIQSKEYEDASLRVETSIYIKDASLQTLPVGLEVVQEIQPKKYEDLEVVTQELESKQYEDASLQVELEVMQEIHPKKYEDVLLQVQPSSKPKDTSRPTLTESSQMLESPPANLSDTAIQTRAQLDMALTHIYSWIMEHLYRISGLSIMLSQHDWILTWKITKVSCDTLLAFDDQHT
ncbi:hypothetical protein M422DRAFT_44419 [Sphaerobolus stellatus SS14]|nr:hypothetical protein M422DRAFT_44419 [Sphaerobolus stellatus SS14]